MFIFQEIVGCILTLKILKIKEYFDLLKLRLKDRTGSCYERIQNFVIDEKSIEAYSAKFKYRPKYDQFKHYMLKILPVFCKKIEKIYK